MASDLRFSYSGLYLKSHKTAPSGPQTLQLHMEGANGIWFPKRKEVEAIWPVRDQVQVVTRPAIASPPLVTELALRPVAR